MTYLQFEQVSDLAENEKFYWFPDRVLATFHAFQVTEASKAILERRSLGTNDANLKTLQSFGVSFWKELFQLLLPRDVFKLIVATRNMGGLFSVNELMNNFIFIKDRRSVSHAPHAQGAFFYYDRAIRDIIHLAEMNAYYSAGFPALKFPVLGFEVDQAIIPLCGGLFAGGLKVVQYNKNVSSGRSVLGSKSNFDASMSPDLTSLTWLNVNGSNLDFDILSAYLQNAINLRHLDLSSCSFDPPVLRSFAESIQLRRLTDLNLNDATIPAFYVSEFLRIAPNLQMISMLRMPQLSEVNFKDMRLNSLLSLQVGDLLFPSDVDMFLELVQAAPNLQSLKLLITNDLSSDLFQTLAPNALKNIKKLNLSDCTINDDLLYILRAAPSVERLILSSTELNFSQTHFTQSFPGIKSLDVSSSTIMTDDLLTLLRLMPNLTELDISGCDGLNDMMESDDCQPMLTLEKLTCDTVILSEEVIELFLEIAPNLKGFSLDFDIEFDSDLYEPTMRKYSRLIDRGYQLVQKAFEDFLEQEPEERARIGAFLPQYLKISEDEIDDEIEDESTSLKHVIEDGESSASKRLRLSDE